MRDRSYKTSTPKKRPYGSKQANFKRFGSPIIPNDSKEADLKPMMPPRGDLKRFRRTQRPKKGKKYESSDEKPRSNAFAGACFQTAPSASLLPKPPMHLIKKITSGAALRKLQFDFKNQSK